MSNAMFKFSYGLFVLTSAENGRDNGCIINTAIQVTAEPKHSEIARNKSNYTCSMIEGTKAFNLSVISEEADLICSAILDFKAARRWINLQTILMRNGQKTVLSM